jgi:hypothetical protein
MRFTLSAMMVVVVGYCAAPSAFGGLITFDVTTELQISTGRPYFDDRLSLTNTTPQTYSLNPGQLVDTPPVLQLAPAPTVPPASMPMVGPDSSGRTSALDTAAFNFQVKITDLASGQSGVWSGTGAIDLNYVKNSTGPWYLFQNNAFLSGPWNPSSSLITRYEQTGILLGNNFYQVFPNQFSSYQTDNSLFNDPPAPTTVVAGLVIEAGAIPTPEPGTMVLVAVGLLPGAGFFVRRRRQVHEAR